MSSERGRVIGIFATVAVLGAGAGTYFFKIYRPNQVRRDAQGEIAAWEARFAAARACLLGPHPASPKTSEALAIREMTPDPWDRGSCTPLISKLSRGEAPDSGIPVVETAWTDVEHAATKAAVAFATHVGSSTTLKQDPLPAALDALDAARIKLRAAAELTADAAAGTPLRAAQILPLTDGADPIAELTIQTVPSAHGIVVFGKTSRVVQIDLRPGMAPVVSRVADGIVRAVPDATWGARVGPGEIRIGAMDADGAFPAATSFPLGDEGTIAAAVGMLAEGELVYGNRDSLVIARAHGGAITAAPEISIQAGQAAIDLDGRAAIVWAPKHEPSTVKAQIIKPGADEPIVDLGNPGVGDAICLTNDRAWMNSWTSVVGFGGGKPVVNRTTTTANLLGCTGEAVLLRDHFKGRPLQVCTDDCRIVKLPPGAPELSATTVVGGKVIAIAAHGDVLGVWREDGPPVFYGLPELAEPVLAHEWPAMALTDGKVIDVIARGAKTFVVIRIPAS